MTLRQALIQVYKQVKGIWENGNYPEIIYIPSDNDFLVREHTDVYSHTPIESGEYYLVSYFGKRNQKDFVNYYLKVCTNIMKKEK